ncbi:unnamed protein product [Amoebophrya sp. A25]|nr:unnamed protein product [Amoebophrya sp. A25]|eukprot:GSA25T00013097001.1
MIKILDTFFMCPWPKVVIVPTASLRQNFLQELIKFPSSLRRFWAAYHPQYATEACGAENWASPNCIDALWVPRRGMVKSMEDTIALKNKIRLNQLQQKPFEDHKRKLPGIHWPQAPTRILSYGQAGGCAMPREGTSKDPDPVLRFGKEQRSFWSDAAMWTRTIVLLDEAHNIAREDSKYRTKLERLRNALGQTSADRTRLVMFTATPAGNRCGGPADVDEGTRPLITTLLGKERPECQSEEGFVSYFDAQGAGFPTVQTSASVARTLGSASAYKKATIQQVTMGSSVALRYVRTHLQPSAFDEEKRRKQLQARCGVWVPPQFAARVENAHLLEEATAQEYATKAYHAAQKIRASRQKALVLCRKRDGLQAVARVFRSMLGPSGIEVKVLIDRAKAPAAMQQFNSADNTVGSKALVLIADTETCGEGVSFFQVRQCHFLSMPESVSEFYQWLGRSNRFRSHHALPLPDRTVEYFLYVAEFPSCWHHGLQPGAAAWSFFRTLMGPALRSRIEHKFLHNVRRLVDFYHNNAEDLRAAFGKKRADRDPILEELGIKSNPLASFWEKTRECEALQLLRQTEDEKQLRKLKRNIETYETAIQMWRQKRAFDWGCY